ncbi:MAG TPA: hypothetical protein VJT73_17995 [Polyangiaceae bacterium]|nr:hypothetical protein [Polyangiaceae bacterium]
MALSSRFALALALFFACSAPALRGNVYRGDGLAFRLGEIPATWQSLKVSHARLAFYDQATDSTVLVNGRCGKDGDDVPLLALTKHLFIEFTEREIMEQKLIAMDGREAMHTVLKAKLDGVPRVFDAYVLKKDGCVYDFVDASKPDDFESHQAAFARVVAGFHTLPKDD